MKTICKFTGKLLLCMAVFISFSAPASVSSIGVEEIPESLRKKR